ncbi:hypothetical protein RRG08_060148 [Elysia crispata]|uniref:Uncharacterized protein n=1 Tax=Elysia crispata TaxID=231223 RepID=A0AAE1A091_9GAST|nr:hypothetical protein RRG08_060148 [Elysia crispata]
MNELMAGSRSRSDRLKTKGHLDNKQLGYLEGEGKTERYHAAVPESVIQKSNQTEVDKLTSCSHSHTASVEPWAARSRALLPDTLNSFGFWLSSD